MSTHPAHSEPTNRADPSTSQRQPEPDENGDVFWWDASSELHRTDGPASISADGAEGWFRHGKPHRVDGPAFYGPTIKSAWWVNGVHLVDPDNVLPALDVQTRADVIHLYTTGDNIATLAAAAQAARTQ